MNSPARADREVQIGGCGGRIYRLRWRSALRSASLALASVRTGRSIHRPDLPMLKGTLAGALQHWRGRAANNIEGPNGPEFQSSG
jgi:hypothetical protein